jgi:predicted phosphodiesterase
MMGRQLATTGRTAEARLYRDKYGMEMPTRKLARLLYDNNRLLFNDVEDARKVLRRIEGKAEKGRAGVTHPYGNRPANPYNLPESDEREWLPYKLTGAKKVGILCDIHVPYHSISAITCALDRFVKFGIDCLLLNGDVVDMYSLSKFERDPKKRNFADELEVFAQLIESFSAALGCRIIMKLGNHEERYDKFLLRKAYELDGVEEFTIESILKKRAPGVEIVKDKRVIHANALDVLHGHEFSTGFFSPVNIARGLALRAKTNALQGHNHITSEHTEPNLRGEIKTTWSVGCACELHPEYMPINKWNHGFAELELSNNTDEFRIENYRVKDGRVL